MRKKEPLVRTKRLLLRPLTDSRISALIEDTRDEDLRQAYIQMRDGCAKDPANRVWYAPWGIFPKGERTAMGDLCFKGPPQNGTVEIGYGIDPAYQGKGYTTEAVKAMCWWAFGSGKVVFLEAEAEPDNKASVRVLEKCGFRPDGEGTEGTRFLLEKPMTNWMSVYMLLGMSIGMSLGNASGNMPVGMSLGLCIGLAVGAGLDSSAKKEREKQRREREAQKGSR